MKTLRKICSAIVILALCLGMVSPAALAADGDTGFSWTLEDGAPNEATSGTDVNLNKTLTGGTLTVTGGSGESITVAGSGVTVTLSGDITSSGNISCTMTGSLNITEGNISVGGIISSLSTINISGGHVTASGITMTGTSSSFTYQLTITGGVVDVGSITIQNNGTSNANSTFTVNGNSAVVFADEVTVTAGGTASKNYQNGVVFEGTSGKVYGNVTLPDDVTIPAGYTLTIPSGASLTVPSGTTLTNEGTITVESGGTFTNSGTIENYGTINGNVGGSGSVKVPATVTMDNATATYGSTVTLTANVTGGSGAVNDGTVYFYQGTDTTGTPLNSGGTSVNNGTATYELTLTGTNWKPSDTPYTITAVYTPASGSSLLSGSDDATLTVSKGTQATPPVAPSSASNVSTNSVTLTAVSGSNIEYGYTTGTGGQPGNWQTEITFNNLSAGTDYTFYTRYAETDYYEASDPSTTGLTVTTLPQITTTSLDAGYVGVQYRETLEAGVASGKTVTWALADNSTLPAGLTLNSDGTITGTPTATAINQSFTVQATIKGGQNGTEDITNTANLSITINQGTPDITATTYNGEEQTDTFTYGDTITVSGKIAASATAPGTSTNAITQNQVGLYLDETELATADVESDGSFTLTYNTSNNGITPGADAQTLTVRYGGSSDLISGSTTVQITLNKATPTAPVGPIATSSIETTSVTLLVDDPSTSPYGDIQYGYTTGNGSASDINNWQTGTGFSNLQPGTDYIFYARYAGNDFYNSSPASKNSLTVTTRPEITTTSLDTGYVGVYYEAQLSANVDSVKNVTWSIPTSSLPTGLQLSGNTISGTPTATGTFDFIVQASIGGGTDSMVTLTITINAGTPTFTANTYNGDNQTSTFNYGDTITVNGTIAASSQAPGNGINAITEPEQNQVGLYLDDNQLATASVESDGSFTLTYDTSGKGITPSESAQTLTVKYGGSSSLNSGETTVTITLNKKPVTATFTGSTTKIYDGNTNPPEDLTISLSNGDVVGNDDVTVTADSITYDNANVGENKTITASGLSLGGGDADWYSLSNETVTTTGSITKQAQNAPAEGDGYSINYTAETITVTDDTYELSADSAATSGSTTLDVTPGTDVYIRFKETDTQEASAWTTVDIPSRPAAPQNVRGGTNSITNVSSVMAYSADGETWTAITGERVTNLRAGSYLVRFQATADAFASESASVTVRDYVAPPTTPSEPEKPSGPSTGDSDGWTSITDELDKLNPDTQEEPLTIEMNGETEVPKEVFETIAGKDVDVVFDMGDGVSWSVNGADIPADADLSNLDLGVSMNTDGIPVDVINAITGEATSVQITLAHDGDFGFALTLSAPLGEANAGYWANLYHYNETSETMDFETAAIIDDDGTANLRMTHASQYAIVIDDHPHETVLPFTDVNAGDWFYDPVVWAYGQGLMTGTSATIFEPNTSTTRAMIVAILNRLEDGPTADGGTFTDVADGDWYAEAVNWAASVGIVAGFEDGTFRPNAPITREQMAAILYNYAQWKGYDISSRADLSRYMDAEKISIWAMDVVRWAVAEGLLTGVTEDTLAPQASATRAQVAAIFQRFLSE